MIGHVRLDAIESVLIARAYVCPVDTNAPLRDMTAPYVAVATVTVAGDTAYVQALHGTMTHAMRSDFRAQIAALGVHRILWRRQTDRHGIQWSKEEVEPSGTSIPD